MSESRSLFAFLKPLLFIPLGVSLLYPAVEAAPSKPFRVLIDAGHGGADHGAVRQNIKEADLVLSISKKLYEILKSDPNFEPHMSRTAKDQTIALDDRVRKAEASNSDLFISLHANASTDSRARGVEFYFSPVRSGQEASLWLSHLSLQAQQELADLSERPRSRPQSDVDIIVQELKDQRRIWESQELSRSLWKSWALSGERKVVRQAPFRVVHQNSLPSVLVEVGYLSNPAERAKLLSPEYQQRVALEIHKGLEHFRASSLEQKRPHPPDASLEPKD